MNAIDCTLTPVSNDDASTLYKMRVFGIFTPDEDKVTMKGQEYYCVTYSRAHFNEDSLTTLESEESISDATKKAIKTQYMKICSFAFIFGIGKDCVRDKYNRLIPVDLFPQDQRIILENNNGMYPPYLVSEITDDIYDRLNKLEESNVLTSNQKWELISKYQDQLYHDDLFIEEPGFGTCCCCGGLCDPCSQTCGACPRNGRLMALGLGLIDQDAKSNDAEVEGTVVDASIDADQPDSEASYSISTSSKDTSASDSNSTSSGDTSASSSGDTSASYSNSTSSGDTSASDSNSTSSGDTSASDSNSTSSGDTSATAGSDCGVSSTVVDVHRYNGEDVCILKDVIKRYRDQFRGCLDPKKAIVKKSISHYVVSSHKKQWVPCADIKERKAKILVSVSWVRDNIHPGFQ
jgi:hypothetical protein